nr:type II secretion system protein GspN [uncultured Desulfobulbus sp.]
MRTSTERGASSRGRLRRAAGYLLYALFAVVLSLWLMFPVQSVQRLLQDALSGIVPGVEWRVGRVELRLPLILRVENVFAFLPANRETPALQVDRLDVGPNWDASIRNRDLWLNYDLRIGAGVIQGRLRRQPQPGQFTVHGAVQGLPLAAVPLLAGKLGRQLEGTLSASYEGKGCPGADHACLWNMQCKIASGKLALARPMLRHTELPFSLVSLLVHGKGAEMTIAEGKIDSPLGKGWFNGSVTLAADPLQSLLKLRGGLHPQPALFKHFENTVELQAVRRELEKKPLPFSISGSAVQPGVHFESMAMQISTLEKETR